MPAQETEVGNHPIHTLIDPANSPVDFYPLAEGMAKEFGAKGH